MEKNICSNGIINDKQQHSNRGTCVRSIHQKPLRCVRTCNNMNKNNILLGIYIFFIIYTYMSYSRGSSVCDTYETRRERERETPQVVGRIHAI